MLGVTIEVDNIKKHTWKDWHLKWCNIVISSAEPKTNYIDVPGMDGQLDLSEALTGDIQYKNRSLTLKFETNGDFIKWSIISSEIMNFLHGRKAKITLDTDLGFYYIGRLTLASTKEDYFYGELTLTGDVEPYKYEITSSTDNWLWDTFSFENGIIRDYKDLVVSETLQLIIKGRRKIIYPKITASAAMSVKLNNKTYNLNVGENIMYDMPLKEGYNILIFTGNGTVSIDYRGGSL